MKFLSYTQIIVVFFLSSCKNANDNKKDFSLIYPETKKVDSVFIYFDQAIADPYNWLENDQSEETKKWVKSQNEVTFGYLNKIPFRQEIKKRLEKMWNYEKISSPHKEGEFTYFYKNDGLQNQYVLYRTKKDDDIPEVFLDPNSFSEDGTTSLTMVRFSKDGSLLAYTISEGGSDWKKLIVMTALNKTIVEDTLKNIKFSEVSWYKNKGFYYSSYDKPTGSELSAKTDTHKLYYHKLGTDQKEDVLVFGGKPKEKSRYASAVVSEDNRYLFISSHQTTSGNTLFLKYLKHPEKPLVKLTEDFDSDTYFLDNNGDQLFFMTNWKAPNKRIVIVDANKPHRDNWKDIVPETEHVLTPTAGSGFLFANYMKDALSSVKQYDYSGNLIREVDLPGIGSTYGFKGKKEDPVLYYIFSNYTTPSTIYSFDPKNGKSTLYKQPKVEFTSSNYESKQIFYTSKDGTKIPMIISYKKGTKLNGKNPTILYGYGGFNISVIPLFSITNAFWMKIGGIYAVPNIRGGGEYGEKWHKAGTKTNKQNVFDDFISAAEYLIKNNYTSSDYLAISGRSNGGLLVGATMTQRPDLMKVALPSVGVLDMLRYHTFTSGAGWAYDFGTSEENKEMFHYLLGYSPLHNVKENTSYPATLVTTGDHDDRVVPAHSFKFISELQHKQKGGNPTLIRIETNTGHGTGTPVSKQIEESTDVFGFILFNLGFDKLLSSQH